MYYYWRWLIPLAFAVAAIQLHSSISLFRQADLPDIDWLTASFSSHLSLTAANNASSLQISSPRNVSFSHEPVVVPHIAPFEFSACLLVKDDNQILPEWLAYHYTVLPLRRLIVGVDPLSKTSPEHILDGYRAIGMNITTWTGNWYWEDGRWSQEKYANFNPLNYTWMHGHNMHRVRQLVFLRTCLKQLKQEGRDVRVHTEQ